MIGYQIAQCGIACYLSIMRMIGRMIGLLFLLYSPSILAFDSPFGFSSGFQGVVGGVEVSPQAAVARSAVRLAILSSGGESDETGSCTGTLISPQVVLTAAHCLSGKLVGVRIDFAAAPDQSVMASRYFIHPEWNSSADSNRRDLALLYFDGAVATGAAPALLYSGDVLSLPRSSEKDNSPNVLIAGYGVTDPDEPKLDGILRQTGMNVMGSAAGDCVELRDLANGSDACFGDSGGPGYLHTESGEVLIWGVASYVDEPACRHSSFYTNLAVYRDWLSLALEQIKSATDLRKRFTSSIPTGATAKLENKLCSLKKETTRFSTLREFSKKRITPSTRVGVDLLMAVLQAFSTDEYRLKALKLLSPNILLENRNQAELLSMIFTDESSRPKAISLMNSAEVIFLPQ